MHWLRGHRRVGASSWNRRASNSGGPTCGPISSSSSTVSSSILARVQFSACSAVSRLGASELPGMCCNITPPAAPGLRLSGQGGTAKGQREPGGATVRIGRNRFPRRRLKDFPASGGSPDTQRHVRPLVESGWRNSPCRDLAVKALPRCPDDRGRPLCKAAETRGAPSAGRKYVRVAISRPARRRRYVPSDQLQGSLMVCHYHSRSQRASDERQLTHYHSERVNSNTYSSAAISGSDRIGRRMSSIGSRLEAPEPVSSQAILFAICSMEISLLRSAPRAL